jgi:tRNA modification GTPase
LYPLDDNIAAIASAPGGAARGIVRLSGPDAATCLAQVFVADNHAELTAIREPSALVGRLKLDSIAASLPCDVYLWPTERSYTRQPTAEIHTLGSPPLLEAALRTICTAGARVAQPGEFTLRAFLAGRLDLTQAEAVLGVIDAAGRRELDVALAQLAGGLAGPLNELRDQLLDLLAHLEAGLDFVEEDIEFISAADLEQQLETAASKVADLANQMAARTDTANLARVVLMGYPNVGKSSLFNALVGHSAAIVSEAAGTTRDYLTARLAWDDASCELIDTAGIEHDKQPDTLAGAAQEIATVQHDQAHVQLLCLDATRPLNVWEQDELARGSHAVRIVVFTKSDVCQDQERLERRCEAIRGSTATSSESGTGLSDLLARLREEILSIRSSESAVVAGTAVRCGQSLRLAAESLARAVEVAHAHGGEELVAAEARVALNELGQVVGAVYTDDILDRIFSRFCIGK